MRQDYFKGWSFNARKERSNSYRLTPLLNDNFYFHFSRDFVGFHPHLSFRLDGRECVLTFGDTESLNDHERKLMEELEKKSSKGNT